MRISWRSFTGYRPKAAGKARSARTRTRKPSMRPQLMLARPGRGVPSSERPPEQALRPRQHDDRHHRVDHQHRESWKPRLPEGLGLPDDEASDQRALQRAQPADYHHDQGGDEDAHSHGWIGGLDRPRNDAGQPAEGRAEGKDEGEHAPDVDSEPGSHLRVVHARANDGAEARALDQEPQKDGHHESEGDDEETVGRKGELAELRSAGEERR